MPEKSPPSTHGRGRPSSHESHEIDEIVKGYFLKGATPAYVMQETGFEKNTVYPRYQKLTQMVEDTSDKDFLERYKNERAQFVLSIDALLMKSHEILAYAEKKLEECKKQNDDFPTELIQKLLDVEKFILTLKKEKMNHPLNNNLDDLKNKIKKILGEMQDE